MIGRVAFTLVFYLSLPAAAEARLAEIACDDSARMTHRLTHGLGAERRGTGLRDPGTVVELCVTTASGDWLIVQSYANGTSGIVAMGAGWQGDLSGPA